MLGTRKKQTSSRLRSFYLKFCRRLPCSNYSSSNKTLPIDPIPFSRKQTLPPLEDNNKRSSTNTPRDHHPHDAEVGQSQRVSELEREIVELEKWLQSELVRLRSHLASSKRDSGKCCAEICDGEKANNKLQKLDGVGGYLYTIKSGMLDMVTKDLAIQFSSPAVVPPEMGSSVSEVLNVMAMLGREILKNWLLESMPMIDISAVKPQGSLISSCDTTKDFEDAIILSSISELGELVMEGMRIEKAANDAANRQCKKKNRKRGQRKYVGRINNNHAGDQSGALIMAMLIQPRDPQKGYQPVNEMMIGFVEAVAHNEENEFVIKGIHVAGLMARSSLWCISLPMDMY